MTREIMSSVLQIGDSVISDCFYNKDCIYVRVNCLEQLCQQVVIYTSIYIDEYFRDTQPPS